MWHRNAPTYLNIAAIAIIILITAAATTINKIMISPIISYFNAVWSGSEDPFWPHVILVPLSVAAAIAVGFAIFADHPRLSPKFSTATHTFALWCLIVGVPIESICTVLLFLIDERISIAQQSTIISLRRAAGPRNLTSDEIHHIIDVLKPLGARPYDLTRVPMLESGSFLDDQIVGALKGAGWTLMSIKGNGEKAQIPLQLFTVSQTDEANAKLKFLQSDLFDSSRLTDIKIGLTHDIVGVEIVFRNNDFTTPAFSLSTMLNDAGIGGSAGWTLDTGMSDDAIHVIIGRK